METVLMIIWITGYLFYLVHIAKQAMNIHYRDCSGSFLLMAAIGLFIWPIILVWDFFLCKKVM